MLRSMTGYGRGQAQTDDVTVVVELRSVNNRFRDVQLRVPREYMALEPRINSMLKDPFSRGRVDAYVRRSSTGSQQQVVADVALAQEYGRVISSITKSLSGLPELRQIPLEFILARDGVLSVTEAPVDYMREVDVVETAIQAAVADIIQMRETEGKALCADLKQNLTEMMKILDEIEEAIEGINERLRQRLEARIRRMIGDRFDAYRITQEVALLVDKSDVSEETTRLRSHCEQFGEALDAEDPVGRRLDFLLQEMNREVNTIGSKSVEHPVSTRVVTLKTVLERMREQSQNVE